MNQFVTNDLRIAMVGVGLRGSLLNVAHQPGKGSVIVAICDLDEALLQERAKGIEPKPWLTTSFENVLRSDDIDAVIIATPDYIHEEMVIASLEAGKATFAEKPLAITTAGCDRILASATKAASRGVRLYVGHNLRHYAVLQKMKALSDEGRVPATRVAEAIKKYKLNTEKGNPLFA